jgi:hypothetical protein
MTRRFFAPLLVGMSFVWACSSKVAPSANSATSVAKLAVAAPTSPVPAPVTTFPTTRNPVKWPFSSESVWNMPIGDGAQYVPANLPKVKGPIVASDENILILTPSAPLMDVVTSDAGWDKKRSRCGEAQRSQVRYQIPVPAEFVTDPGFEGLTPNHAAAILMPDGRTIRQTQPFHVCGGFSVTAYDFNPVDLYSEGRIGAHGGSGLSAVGGTIRIGELVKGGAIRHAMKFELNAGQLLSYPADGSPGFRWPAVQSDVYAASGYKGSNPLMEMGTLLALPRDFQVKNLKSDAGRIMASALQDYGAYIVDDTDYDVYAFATEWGPDGRTNDEMQRVFGHRFSSAKPPSCTDTTPECLWAQDMESVILSLAIVTNSEQASPGGPGVRVTRCAPSLNAQDRVAAVCPTVALGAAAAPSPPSKVPVLKAAPVTTLRVAAPRASPSTKPAKKPSKKTKPVTTTRTAKGRTVTSTKVPSQLNGFS